METSKEGRVGRIWEAKQSGATRFRGEDLYEVGHFFSRWRLIPKYDFLILASFVMGSLGLLVFWNSKSDATGNLVMFLCSVDLWSLPFRFQLLA